MIASPQNVGSCDLQQHSSHASADLMDEKVLAGHFVQSHYYPAAYTSAPELGVSCRVSTSLMPSTAITTPIRPQRTTLATAPSSFPSIDSSSSTSLPTTTTASSLRRKVSSTKRSLKASHRIAVRRIIAAAQSQQQEQQHQERQDLSTLCHHHPRFQQSPSKPCKITTTTTADRSSSPFSFQTDHAIHQSHYATSDPAPSRSGTVTEAIFQDKQQQQYHHSLVLPPSPMVTSTQDQENENNHPHHHCEYEWSPNLINVTPPCIIPRNTPASDPSLPSLSALSLSSSPTSALAGSLPLSAISSGPSTSFSCPSSLPLFLSSSKSSSSTRTSSSASSCYFSLISSPSPSHLYASSSSASLSPCSIIASPYPLGRSCDSFLQGQDSPRRQPSLLSSSASTAELQASVVAAHSRPYRGSYQEQHLQQHNSHQQQQQQLAAAVALHRQPVHKMSSFASRDAYPFASSSMAITPTTIPQDRQHGSAGDQDPFIRRTRTENNLPSGNNDSNYPLIYDLCNPQPHNDHYPDHGGKFLCNDQFPPSSVFTTGIHSDSHPHPFSLPLATSFSAPSLLVSSTTTLSTSTPHLADNMNMRTLNPSASWTLSDDTHAVLREVLSSQMQTRHSLQQEKKSYKLKSLLPTGSSRSRPAPRSRKVAADEIQTLPLRRRSTLRRKGTGSNRTSELLRQRRQTTPKFARYLDMKPLPLVRSFSDAKRQQRHDQHVYQGLEPGQTEKPLPPIPQAFGVFRWDLDIETKTCIEEYNIPNKACIDGQGPSEQRVNHQQQNLSTYKEEMGESKMAITSLSEKSLVQENCESDHPQQPKGGITDRRNDSIEITPSAPQSVTNQDSQLVAITATIESPAEKEQQLPLPLFLSVDPNLDGPSSSSSTSSSSSHKRLDSFRFPLRKSPTERRIMARSKQHRHNHHHSLPYNSTRSHHTGKVMDANSLSPLDPLHHTRCSSTATTTSTGSDQDFITSDIIKALTGQTQKSQLYAHRCKESQGSTQEAEKKPGLAESSSSNSTTVTTERHHRRKGQQRLRRSESCGSSTLAHRPSLSFNSSKKELLSLQARRINKPDAKVLRLPEIQTNSAAMPIKTTAKPVIMIQDMAVANNENTTVVGPGSIVSSDSGVDATSTPSLGGASGSMVIKSGQISPSDMTDYQLQVSDKDRLAIDSILQELTTTDDTLQTGISSPTKALSTSAILTRPSSAIINAQLDVPQLPYHPDSTLSTPDTAGVGSTLDQTSASVMVSGPQTDATSESKRFVKRSHALRELVSTEMSYVNDLDILIHVHLKVLKSKSWFPLKIHTCLINCAAELLLTHRRFLTVLEGNIICAPERAQAPLSVYKTLAEAFETLCNDQDWYDDFCEHRMRTIKALNKYANATHLAVLQRESTDLMAQQNRPKVRADLKDLLIKPIQRVCRYPLLLKEVLRLTNIQDPEYAYVTDTHNRMRDLAHDLDETQKRVERKLLTEQFLKKLAETNLPKKYVFSAVAMGSAGSNGTDPHNSYSSHNGGEVLRVHPPQASMGGDNTTQANGGGSGGGGMAVHSPAGMSHGGDYFDHGLGADGVIPSPLTRAFVGSLGSILLAGALEFVLIPEIPIRLKYYGCFLFETMLLVVKAKKASLYEPRQWLPLRLCELQETTKLDGYTRFGWSLMFDQFRIDFGAKDEEEQEIWMRNLRIQIQAAKMAYAQLPIGLAAFQTLTSSLPWRMSKAQVRSVLSSRHYQHLPQHYQHHFLHSPSNPSSPWSENSSALSSPQLTSTTFNFGPGCTTTSSLDPERWNNRGNQTGATEDNCDSKESRLLSPLINESSSSSQPGALKTNANVGNSPRIVGGMAGDSYQVPSLDSPTHSSPSRSASRSVRPHQNPQHHHHPTHHLQFQQQQLYHQQQYPSVNHLYPSSPVAPWLLSENRQRTHSFDVTRVFASSSTSGGGIKPNQRTLVQNMFKDISTENIWTTTPTSVSTTNTGTPYGTPLMGHSPSLPSASALSPFPSLSSSSRHGLPSPFVPSAGNSPSQSGMVSGMARSLTNEEDFEGGPTDTSTVLRSSGSSSTSLTSRILRRRDSGTKNLSPSNGMGTIQQERSDWDRRRSSATAAIAATLALNFRKNSPEIQHPGSSSQPNNHYRRSSMNNELFQNSDHFQQENHDGLHQRISVKACAQLFERRASSFHHNTSPLLSSPLSTKPRTAGAGFGGRIKTSQSHQEISTLQSSTTTAPPFLVARSNSMRQDNANGDTLYSLNSAAECAQSRRLSVRRSVQIGNIDGEGSKESSSTSPAVSRSTTLVTTNSNNSHSTGECDPHQSTQTKGSLSRENSHNHGIDKIWSAMGRLTHLSKSHSHGSGLSQLGTSPSSATQPAHSLTGTGENENQTNSLLTPGTEPRDQMNWSSPTSSSSSSMGLWRRRSNFKPQNSSQVTVDRPVASSPHMVPMPLSPTAPAPSSQGGTYDSHDGDTPPMHSRTLSASTSQSTDSDSSLIFIHKSSEKEHLFFSSSPSTCSQSSVAPRLTLTPSVSITSIASTSSSIYSNTLSVTDQPNHLAHMNDCPVSVPTGQSSSPHDPGPSFQIGPTPGATVTRSKSFPVNSRPSTLTMTPISSSSHNNINTKSPTTLADHQERRKSLSVLQTFTHSASQKFKIMIRSPTTALRRRSVMSLSPMTIERCPASALTTTDVIGGDLYEEEEEEVAEEEAKEGTEDESEEN